jgi:hypothetical protein
MTDIFAGLKTHLDVLFKYYRVVATEETATLRKFLHLRQTERLVLEQWFSRTVIKNILQY